MRKNSGKDSTMLRLCVAGATGKMGSTVLREAAVRSFQIVGAVEVEGHSNIGKSLRQLGICDSETRVTGSNELSSAVKDADVYITFTTPAAELVNLPTVAALGKRIVMGTTGFTEEQMRRLKTMVEGKVPAVFSPNFSLGVNVLFKIVHALRGFPAEYDISIYEIHHTGKKDAPSGTAKKLEEIVSNIRGYTKTVHGREGISPRLPGELEVAALRLGGVPGIHDVIVAGPYELLRIEHTAFSRSVFAQGALYAAEWISTQQEARIFNMEDVLTIA